MTEQSSSTNPLITQLLADNDLREKVQSLISRTKDVRMTYQDVEALIDSERNYDDLSHLLLMAVNGDTEMREQTVVIEYLKNDQRMLIPGALGMSLEGAGRCRTNAVLRTRYLKCRDMRYSDIKALVSTHTNDGPIREAVNARTESRDMTLNVDWREQAWFMLEDGQPEAPFVGDVIMGVFSAALQFNCDIRDFSALNAADMSVTDDAWKTASTVQMTRLKNKLKPATLQSIAALNLPAVANCALAAWVRAYGLSIGLLPAVTSKTVSEVKWTNSHGTSEAKRNVGAYEKRFERPLISLCCNLLAMFGLFHLNKDHTFKTGDANMDRIAESYLNTMRTDTDKEVMAYVKQNVEALVRTCQHPFGLAQTYWLALVMNEHSRLMTPLAVRTDTTPPPVQRLMICDAAAKEWDGMPAGKAVSALYFNELAVIRAEIARVKAEPPRFSGLFRLYGYEEQEMISEQARLSIAAMMPAVYGYIVTTHTDDKSEKDGLGHALSLKNVERDMKGVVMTWKTAWEKYVNSLDQIGLLDFINQVRFERAQEAGSSVVG